MRKDPDGSCWSSDRRGLEPRTGHAVEANRAIEVRHTKDSPALFTRIRLGMPECSVCPSTPPNHRRALS